LAGKIGIRILDFQLKSKVFQPVHDAHVKSTKILTAYTAV